MDKIRKLRGVFLFAVLNVSLLGVLLFSLRINTSSIKSLPWYQPHTIIYLLIPVYCVPALLVIGIGLAILGRFYNISKLNKRLPFISIAGIILPTLGPLWLGLPINIILCMLVIATIIRDLTFGVSIP